MTVFDLLFILLFLVTVFSLFAAGWFAVRRQFRRAGTILLRVLLGTAAYFTAVVLVSLLAPRRVMKLGERQCFDDMCVSVNNYRTRQRQTGVEYAVEMGLFNRGRGVSQRENNLVVYLTDNQGQRYDPIPDDSSKPFNVLLPPHESAAVNRTFEIPESATGVSAVITHEGGFPIGWLIIDYDTWFRKPPLVPLS